MAAPKKKVRTRRRERKNIERGAVHISSSFNNTMVTITDTNGNAIDVENLYYRIFMDDELYTFESIDYSDFSSDVTEVPASLNTSDFSKSGSEHLILLRDAPKEKIGIQSVYRSGDNVSYSKIGYYDIATGEVTYVDDPTTGVGATLTANDTNVGGT